MSDDPHADGWLGAIIAGITAAVVALVGAFAKIGQSIARRRREEYDALKVLLDEEKCRNDKERRLNHRLQTRLGKAQNELMGLKQELQEKIAEILRLKSGVP